MNSPTPVFVPLAGSLVGRVSADQYFTVGLGTQASPALLGPTALPTSGSVRIDFTPDRVYGLTSTLSVGLGQDNTRFIGNGATLKYWGTGTIARLIDFSVPTSSPTNAAVLQECAFLGFKLDCLGSSPTNQAINGFYANTSHHMDVDVTILNGGTSAADAVTIVACTKPTVRMRCDRQTSPGATNFARGFVNYGLQHALYGYVVSSVLNLDYHVNGVSGDGVYLEGIFGSNLFGASENNATNTNVTSWGLRTGSAVSSINLFANDFEGNGTLGFNGARHAVRFGSNTIGVSLFGTQSFDGFVQVDDGAANILIHGGLWNGCTNSTTGGVTLIGVRGMDLDAGSFGGTLAGVRILDRPGGAADQFSSLKVSSSGPSFEVNNTDTGVSGTALHIKSARTGHVQDWMFQLGYQDFNALCLVDNTAGVLVMEAKEGGSLTLGASAKSLGFYGSGGAVKPTITGSRSANAALASLLTALASQGLLTDSTT